MEQKPRVIVIGAGYAGKRFIKVLSYLREKNSESIDFIGIIDVSEEKLADIPTHLKTETSLHKALEETQLQLHPQ